MMTGNFLIAFDSRCCWGYYSFVNEEQWHVPKTTKIFHRLCCPWIPLQGVLSPRCLWARFIEVEIESKKRTARLRLPCLGFHLHRIDKGEGDGGGDRRRSSSESSGASSPIVFAVALLNKNSELTASRNRLYTSQNDRKFTGGLPSCV